jgi:hypothetical protein
MKNFGCGGRARHTLRAKVGQDNFENRIRALDPETSLLHAISDTIGKGTTSGGGGGLQHQPDEL